MRWTALGRDRLLLYAFLLPGLLYVGIWRIAPAFYTIALSLTSFDFAREPVPSWVGLSNFGRLLHDRSMMGSLGVTSEFAIAVTIVELILGLAIAILFNREFYSRNLVLGIFLVPMVLAPVVAGSIWYVLFNAIVGPIPFALKHMHLGTVQWLSTPRTALVALVVADVWEWTPLMTLLLLAALQMIGRDVIEAATVDGASGFRILRHITLPQIADMIGVAIGLRFMDAFKELDKVIVMTGGGPGTSTELLSLRIYKQAFQFFSLGYASSAVVALLALLAVVYILSYLMARRFGALRYHAA